MRILCFGDSNTYGYDPRSYFGGRYSPEDRWVDLLAVCSGWEVLNGGANGREIPKSSREIEQFLLRLSSVEPPPDVLMIMLGSNDLLQGNSVTDTASFMNGFIGQIPMNRKNIVLVAPPLMQSGEWVTDNVLILRSAQLTAAYQKLASDLGCRFINTEKWMIDITFDGVHFSEKGHHDFAEKLYQELKKLM